MKNSKYQIIQWGTGYTGVYALQHVLNSPDLDLVGLKCFTESKEGVDAGEIAGTGEVTGIQATLDTDTLLALDADCVIYMPRDALVDPSVEGSPSRAWLPDLLALLKSGKNVVSSIATCAHWKHFEHGAAFHDEINEACKEGNSSVFFTGFDPGFTSDALAVSLTSVLRDVTEVRTWEILDYADYTVESTMRQLGFGVEPNEEMAIAAERTTKMAWGGAVHLLAESMGVEIDRIEVEMEGYPAPKTYTTPGGITIEEGTVAAFMFAVNGYVDGTKRFSINHVTRMGQDMAPDWPNLGKDGGYRVEIDAYPPFCGDFPMGQPGGTGSSFDDALVTTAARCVNSIDAVVQSEPGYRTILDLPPINGLYSLTND